MKRLTYQLNRQAIENLLIKEWHIATSQERVYQLSLESLGISAIEVNWFLHLLEWNHQVNIAVEEVSLQTTLRAFIQLVLQSADQIDTNRWATEENRQAS